MMKCLLMTSSFSQPPITVERYHQMAEAGLLPERGVELIHGEIVPMSPIGRKHAAMVDRLNRLLARLVGEECIIRIQNPIIADDFSEPEPDISIVHFRSDFYESALPQGKDVVLLIEVADSSLQRDYEVKLPLYAASGIPECWIINLEEQVAEVFWEAKDGVYQHRERIPPGGQLEARGLWLRLEMKQLWGG
jgi:Uma2 family endonuclease